MISVCMATYNGEKFVKRQLNSILVQLDKDDEIIIVDDCSKDSTLEVIARLKDDRIKISVNEKNLGVIKSFEKAIILAQNEIIILSDQDDVWFENKVMKIRSAFLRDKKLSLFTHDGIVVNGEDEVIDSSWNDYGNCRRSHNVFKIIYKNNYTGCMMAFDSSIKQYILPFPKNIEMHDQWIALKCIKHKLTIINSDDKLIKYIRHGNNLTGTRRRGIFEKLSGRLKMLLFIIIY